MTLQIAHEAVKRGACQNPEEFAGFLQLVATEAPRMILEIGTSVGGSFFGIAQAAPDDAHIISLDYGPGSPVNHAYATAETLRTYLKPGQQLCQVWRDSQQAETRDAIAQIAGGPPHLHRSIRENARCAV